MAILNDYILVLIFYINKENLEINSFDTIHCKIKKESDVTDMQLNHKYQRILLIAVSNTIELFEIPEIPNQNEIEKPKFIFKEHKSTIICGKFNPFNSHIIASSSHDNTIKIWSIRKPTIKNINCINTPKKMKWESNGNLLGFVDNKKIKIYDTKNKKIIFELEFSGRIIDINYEFIDHQNIIMSGNEKNKIFKYKFMDSEDSEVKVKKKKYNQYDEIFEIQYNLISMLNEYFIIYSKDGTFLYNDDFTRKIYKFNDLSKNPKKIINTDENILFEILDINNDKLKILIFRDKYLKNEENLNKISYLEDEKSLDSNYESEDNDLEDINKDYFERCPLIFLDIKESLNFKFNIQENNNKKEKKYFQIKEIKEILDSNKVHNLIALRKVVIEELSKNYEFKTIKDKYFFYVNLLLKDETNKTLLIKYLTFLKENENTLDKENLIYEKFIDELNYYSIFFEKEELKKIFNYDIISEKDKLLKLLSEYLLNIKNKSLDNYIKKIEKENIVRNFNQPICYNSKELIYYRCNEMIIEDILNRTIKKKNEDKELENKKYIIKEILERDLINKLKSIEKLLPLISLISYSEEKNICNFYLNIIDSEKVSNSLLKEKAEKYHYELISNNNKLKLIALNEVYYFPEELCFENINSDYEKCEKYNYNYLIKNPPLKLEINKIKEFLIITLSSNVFKEAFELLTGNKEYEEIFNKEMIIEFINNIRFLPIDYSRTSAFIDTLSLITFIPTLKKKINHNLKKNPNEIILKTLENSMIIEIIYHEFGHAINSVLSFIENKLKLIGTPRKEFLKIKEGGYYLELALFGKVIKNLSYGEALYILNLNNYNKSLDNFKNGFEKLSIDDLKISGLFSDLNLKNKNEVENLKNEVYIKAKIEEKEDSLKNIKIVIPPKNDILNREIKEEDLQLYY